MPRRSRVHALSIILMLLLLAPGAAIARQQDEARARPNMILILTDDLDLRAMEHLPNVAELLAAHGTTFTNFFVTTPGCCPSRTSILRGQHTHNHQVLRSSGPYGGFDRFQEFDLAESTVATWLQDAGYTTGLIGKYLNGYPNEDNLTYIPPGWDEWTVYSRVDYFDYRLNENGEIVRYGEQPEDYQTDVLARKAVDFVHQAGTGDDPFFLLLAPRAPHGPATPAPRHEETFADARAPRVPSFNEADVSDKPPWLRDTPPLTEEEISAIDALYRDRLRSMLAVDEMVADLIQTLEADGTLDSTYIVFTSDNGYQLGEHRLPDGKGVAYDESHRMPFVIRGPGIAAGAVESRLALNIDLGPTFAELAGVTPPAFTDGRSLVPLLQGEEAVAWREVILGERFRPDHTEQRIAEREMHRAERDQEATKRPWALARQDEEDEEDEVGEGRGPTAPAYGLLRTEQWHYVEYETGEQELYDVVADPYQLENLAASVDPEVLAPLSQRLAVLRGCVADTCRAAEEEPLALPPVTLDSDG